MRSDCSFLVFDSLHPRPQLTSTGHEYTKYTKNQYIVYWFPINARFAKGRFIGISDNVQIFPSFKNPKNEFWVLRFSIEVICYYIYV